MLNLVARLAVAFAFGTLVAPLNANGSYNGYVAIGFFIIYGVLMVHATQDAFALSLSQKQKSQK